ncbi:MAG TPA: 6-bladed beta-propeller [Longimicrobium sp.]|jgi:hypothetical protein|nr:6-bladed beta-propeller [Longimicrobium sp.]
MRQARARPGRGARESVSGARPWQDSGAAADHGSNKRLDVRLFVDKTYIRADPPLSASSRMKKLRSTGWSRSTASTAFAVVCAVVVAACEVKSSTENALPRFEPLARIGSADGRDASTLGVVADVGTDSRGRVLVLDVAKRRLAVFSPQGTLMESLGREGSGPGEFQVPVALAVDARDRVYVLDLARGGLLVFDASGEQVRPLDDLPLRLNATDLCTIGERLFALGARDGRLIHEISPTDGRVIRSLAADTAAADPVMAHLRSTGHLACGPGDTLTFLPSSLPEVLRFSASSGERIGRIAIPGYRAVQITRQADGGVTFRAPEGGEVDTGSSIVTLADGRQLIQAGPVVAGGLITEFGPVRTFVVRWDDASITPLPGTHPRIVSMRGDRAFTADTYPSPSVQVLRVRED